MNNQKKENFLTNLCIATIGFFTIYSSHATFPNVESMLEALRPTAAANAPELDQLITALDGLPTEQQHQQALSTLTPMVGLSVRAASDSVNRQMVKRLNQRVLEIVSPKQGINVGDVWDEIFADEQEVEKTKLSDSEAAEKVRQQQKESQAQKALDEQYQFSFISNEKEKKEGVSDPYKGLWVLALGSETAQKNQDNVYGYDSTLLGVVVAHDWLLKKRWVLGVAGGYQQADADSRGPSGSAMDIKRVNLSLYAYYTRPSSLYLMALLTGAQNRYDTTRKILVPPAGGLFAFSRIANADFNGWESHAHLELGKSWHVNNFYMSPKLFTNYTYWHLESFQESDAGGLNLNVQKANLNSFVVGTGIDLEYQNHFQRAVVVPYLQFYVLHDFVQDKQIATSHMLGGGFDFRTEGAEPEGTTYEAGAGISVHSYKDFIFDLYYDFAAHSRYTRHTAGLKLRYEWA